MPWPDAGHTLSLVPQQVQASNGEPRHLPKWFRNPSFSSSLGTTPPTPLVPPKNDNLSSRFFESGLCLLPEPTFPFPDALPPPGRQTGWTFSSKSLGRSTSNSLSNRSCEASRGRGLSSPSSIFTESTADHCSAVGGRTFVVVCWGILFRKEKH